MARIRTIKPEFFHDEDLAEFPVVHRMTFAGLWLYADKEGRLEDRPKYLKSQIWPYDECDMDSVLDDLNGKFIKRYQVDGKKYIQIINFLKHQKPHHTEKSSVIPPLVNGELTVKQPLENGEPPEGREGKGKERNNTKPPAAPPVEISEEQDLPPSAGDPVKLDKNHDHHDEAVQELKDKVTLVNEVYPPFNTAKFINTYAKRNGRHYPAEVFVRTFSDLTEADRVHDPWAFCVQRFNVHRQNVDEEEHARGHEQRKGDVVSLGEILGKAGGG